MKQTAVEWLQTLYNNIDEPLLDADFQQALQMEREQIINSYHEGYSLAISGEHPKQYDPELYYSQTFKK